MSQHHAPEVKIADAGPSLYEMQARLDDLHGTFEAFRTANDERLAELATRRGADPLTEEKLSRIDGELDRQKRLLEDVTLKARRPQLAAGPAERGGPHEREHKAAFDAYVRRGDSAPYLRLDQKGITAAPNDGGNTVPLELEREIGRRLLALSPIRAIATVREISATTYRKPMATNTMAAGWVGETEARPETTFAPLATLDFPTMQLYAMPAATQLLLDDNAVDLEQWLAGEVENAFALQEGRAFVLGDGVKQPTGFTVPTKVAEASWSWGRLGYVVTGVSNGFPATDPANVLFNLVYALKAGYRQNGRFVLSRSTQAAIRRLKDAQGNYLWQPPATAGGDAALLGFPVTEAEDMPNIAADSFAVAFGDFRRGYLVVDRLGVQVLRDPYTAKPNVLFYTTKRVGGGVQDFDAIKFLKFGVS